MSEHRSAVRAEAFFVVARRVARTVRPLALFSLALLLAGCSATLPPRPELPNGSGLLWQLDKPGQATSFVLGTMHVPDPELLDLPPAVRDALAQSPQAAFEVVTDERQKVRHQHSFIAAALLPEDQSLSDLLGSVAYAQVLRIAGRQRPRTTMIGPYHISRFKPWFVMEIIGKNDSTTSHLDATAPVLDDLLEARAKKAGKKVVGLETFEEQIAITNDLAMDDQVALLKANLRNYDNWHNYATYADIYQRADTAMFYGLWLQHLEGLELGLAHRFNERFLDGRNRLMVERALPLMAEAGTFIAVGALHLPGEQGILRLFEAEGYTLTRLD